MKYDTIIIHRVLENILGATDILYTGDVHHNYIVTISIVVSLFRTSRSKFYTVWHCKLSPAANEKRRTWPFIKTHMICIRCRRVYGAKKLLKYNTDKSPDDVICSQFFDRPSHNEHDGDDKMSARNRPHVYIVVIINGGIVMILYYIVITLRYKLHYALENGTHTLI